MKVEPEVASADASLVIAGALGADSIVRVTVKAVPTPEALLAVSFKIKLPAVVGIPLITPVEELITRPAGRPLTAKELGVLLATVT